MASDTELGKEDHEQDNYEPQNMLTEEYLASMSNAIMRSAQTLSLPEKQIVMLAIAKLESNKFHSTDNSPCIRLTAAEMVESYGVDRSRAYRYLKQAGDRLYERSLVFTVQASAQSKSGRQLGEIFMRHRWIGSQKYHEGEGWIEIVFWPEIVQHLSALKGGFTEYQMTQVATLRSTYSWRLFEVLMQIANKDETDQSGTVLIEIDDFHHAMESPPSLRKDFSMMRRRIIEPAIKELTQKDGWLIEWQPIKRGRTVSHLQFRFARNMQ